MDNIMKLAALQQSQEAASIDLVEEVARAICKSQNRDPDGEGVYKGKAQWQEYVSDAEVAISVLEKRKEQKSMEEKSMVENMLDEEAEKAVPELIRQRDALGEEIKQEEENKNE